MMLRLISRPLSKLDSFRRSIFASSAFNCTPPPQDPNKITETVLRNKLTARLPKASEIEIEDISGGCGAMFQIYVEAPEFRGLNTVKQHQLINEILKEEIKAMHGIRITTAITKS